MCLIYIDIFPPNLLLVTAKTLILALVLFFSTISFPVFLLTQYLLSYFKPQQQMDFEQISDLMSTVASYYGAKLFQILQCLAKFLSNTFRETTQFLESLKSFRSLFKFLANLSKRSVKVALI